MNSKRFLGNYSKNDLRKLILESERRAKFLNRIIDDDIHLNMVSESNSPLKEKYKYMRNNYEINTERNFRPKPIRLKLNNNNNLKLSNSCLYENNKLSEDSSYYLRQNNNINNSINISLINKPLHREKKHFPYINNRGNFFNKENPYLLKRKFINKNVFSYFNNNNHKNSRARHLIRLDNFKEEENTSNSINNGSKYRGMKLERCNSMANLPNNFPKIDQYNDNNNYYKFHPQNNQRRNNRYQEGKHYSPYRYDYEGSRYGDKTYNFLLNGPMRGDVSLDWKYPPLYYCGSINQ
jgi:hypothetical protein